MASKMLRLFLPSLFILQSFSLFQMPSCDIKTDSKCETNITVAMEYVKGLNETLLMPDYIYTLLEFKYATNLTDYNADLSQNESIKLNKLKNEISKNLKGFSWNTFNDDYLLRMAKYSFLDGIPDQNVTNMKRAEELGSFLKNHFSASKVCPFIEKGNKKCNATLNVEPDLEGIYRSSRSHEELYYYWVEWRKLAGNNEAKKKYLEKVDIENEDARKTGFANLAESWQNSYEVDNLKDLVLDVWREKHKLLDGKLLSLEDLYKELHAYVRHKLSVFYNPQGANITQNGMIPAHLLGNVWAQLWDNINDLVMPYPNATSVNITKALLEKNFTAQSMFELADSFYQSLGFEPMTQEFWNGSMITRPTDGRQVVCHGEAYDLKKYNEYRIKMCTEVNQGDLYTIHHEMGHIQYYMQYRHQPLVFRTGANPGFHEAIGDTMALAVTSQTHLKKIKLDDSDESSSESEINNLMLMALSKVAFLPYALVLDLWRWSLFSGNVTHNELNRYYWQLRNDYQGLESPIPVTEDHLDPLGKYHVPNGIPYIRYFFSFVLQFMLYQSLCEHSEQFNPNDLSSKPLYQCDFSAGGSATGQLIQNMMKKGSSENWQILLEEMTGKSMISGESLIRYFEPLYKEINQYNQDNNINVGWT